MHIRKSYGFPCNTFNITIQNIEKTMPCLLNLPTILEIHNTIEYEVEKNEWMNEKEKKRNWYKLKIALRCIWLPDIPKGNGDCAMCSLWVPHGYMCVTIETNRLIGISTWKRIEMQPHQINWNIDFLTLSLLFFTIQLFTCMMMRLL